jgi:hypothetical protein
MPFVRRPRAVLFFAMILFGVGAGILLFWRGADRARSSASELRLDEAPNVSPPASAPALPPAHDSARPALVAVAPASHWPRSPLADGLDDPARTARDDLQDLAGVLARYRETHRAYPAFADNAQLVNALAGANPARAPYLPRDLAVIDTNTGELRDRWGTPYFFHALGRDALEIRSAGPDRELHSADDLLHRLGPPDPPP